MIDKTAAPRAELGLEARLEEAKKLRSQEPQEPVVKLIDRFVPTPPKKPKACSEIITRLPRYYYNDAAIKEALKQVLKK
ncbi:MAG: hypothetical protein ABH871_07365 [Pseudomonadota bacterium]